MEQMEHGYTMYGYMEHEDAMEQYVKTWVHMSWKGTWNIDTPWKCRWHMDMPLNNTWNMVHVSWKGTWNIDIPWKSTWHVDMPWDDRYMGTAPSTSSYGCMRPSRSYLV